MYLDGFRLTIRNVNTIVNGKCIQNLISFRLTIRNVNEEALENLK